MGDLGSALRSPTLHAVVWALVVGLLMLSPGGSLPSLRRWWPMSLDAWIDKLVHLGAFLLLTLLVWRARAATRPGRAWATAAALGAGYGLLLETLQLLIPGRQWETADLAAGGLGILMAWPVASGWALRVLRKATIGG